MIEPSTELLLQLSKFVENSIPTPTTVTNEINAVYIHYILSCWYGKNIYVTRIVDQCSFPDLSDIKDLLQQFRSPITSLSPTVPLSQLLFQRRAVFQLHTRTRKNRPSAARSRVSVALYEVRCVNLNPSLLIKRRSIFTNAYNSRVLFCSLPFTVVVKCTKPSMLRLLLPIFGSIHIMGYVSVPIQKSWRWPRNKR